MIGDLLLLSGNDIPFPEAQVTIHQPTLKEIALIGEDKFFIGCGFLDFSKNLLDPKDKIKLSNHDDFDIFMTIMVSNEKAVRKNVESAKMVLTLIFPLYQIEVRNDCIVLKEDTKEHYLNKYSFPIFKKILSDMFSLRSSSSIAEDDYNPAGDMASRIAEKLKKRHAQLLKNSPKSKDGERISILNRYLSILAVGLQKDLNQLLQYTVYQLYDEFQRFQLKVQWDAYIQAKIAGAQDLEEVDNWMIDLRDQGKNKINKEKIK